MSNNKVPLGTMEELGSTPSPWSEPENITDLFSFRLAYLVRLNDRHAQNVLIAHYGLTLVEWRTLATIRFLGRPSLRHLARTTQQDEGQLSRYVTGLIKRDLLAKNASEQDQRTVELSLTDKGEALHRDVMIFAWKLNQNMFVDFNEVEQRELFTLLDKLFNTISRLESGEPGAPRKRTPH